MREFDNIKDMLYCEIDEISKQNKLDMNTLNILGELVDILKDIGNIETFEEGVEVYGENGYSRNNGGYSQRMPVYYNEGMSYRNGGNYGGSYGGNYGGGYSSRMNNGGYSRRGRGYSYEDNKMHMVDKLTELMNETQDPKDRESIQRLVEQINH